MRANLPTFLVIAALCSACYDFTDPDFPEAGAPAVLQVSVSRDEIGQAIVEAQLAPGLTQDGLVRTVANDTLDVSGLRIAPTEVKLNATRVYAPPLLKFATPSTPFTLNAPRIAEIQGAPHVVWYPLRKLDPDTIVMLRGGDLTLHIDTAVGVSTPTPPIRQWFLELQGKPIFRLSSDGPPPTSLHVPAEWVPSTTDSLMTIILSYYQSGQQSTPARDYIASIIYNSKISWIVRIKGQ